MKLPKIYKFILALFVLPFILVMCDFTVVEITHPEDPQIDTEIEISVRLFLNSEENTTSKMVFGILAPVSWNLAQNAELRLTTTGYNPEGIPSNVTNERLTLMSAEDLITKDESSNSQQGKPWAEGFRGRFGIFNNSIPVEWVMYESQTDFHHTDHGERQIYGDVKITLLTGSENVTVNMGYAFCAKEYNIDNSGSASKELVVTGQVLPEFREQLSTIPEEFGYGDFFSVKFEAVSDDVGTSELAGEDEVYLCGKALLSGGQTLVISEISNRTLMEKTGDTTWQKYIYPKDFFDLPEDAVITATYFYFTNADGSIVEDNSGAGFEILENR